MQSIAKLETLDGPLPEGLKFPDLGLAEPVLHAVEDSGYETPSEIQARAIPTLLDGRDIIGASQTGTGKTAAFALPILTKLKRHGKLRCLVLEPTRELAQQVRDAFVKYAKYLDINVSLLHGGVGYGLQRKELKAGADVVVATPGRLLDFMGGGEVSLRDVRFLVLDESDRMLDMGFIPDIRRIIGQCPKKRQSLLFSATAPPAIEKLAKWMLVDPVRITVGGGTATADTVSHAIYPVDDRQKFDLLTALLQKIDYKSVIIFARTKVGTDMIARWLESTGHEGVGVLHSDRTQKERDEAMARFKSGRCPLLVATDIVSRGIDISDISHIINYDIPQHAEDYVHRIGRTGRMNNTGDAVTLYTASDVDFLRAIERFIGQEIRRAKLDDFDYKWSPILEEEKPRARKRNRGFSTKTELNMGRRRRR